MSWILRMYTNCHSTWEKKYLSSIVCLLHLSPMIGFAIIIRTSLVRLLITFSLFKQFCFLFFHSVVMATSLNESKVRYQRMLQPKESFPRLQHHQTLLMIYLCLPLLLHKKWNFSISTFSVIMKNADLVTFTEEIFYGKHHFFV